jgi:nicotinamidase/pyrazinamidase
MCDAVLGKSFMADLLFWDVDTQFDFIDPQGKLYVPGAEAIVPTLARLTEWATANGLLIVASVDAHQPDDPEFEQHPSHCIAGTPGQQKLPETLAKKRFVIPNRPIKLPPDPRAYEQIIIEKQAFDVFSNPNVDPLLRQLGKPEVVLYGVVTEICVSAATRGLIERGHRVRVLEDAVFALDRAKADAFLQEVRDRGESITRSSDLIGTPTAK